ncbi:MAG: ABC transporter ATP-binding protein [Actinomyces sp.]|uniref:ABC transporter ATP-binding protein n=1 Tax=Actinomyces sp. TaxID=29317 RepID=UPI0026DD2CA7|nr:ABC transporter ATP-binding protein [Actinomyces sp.]MDO4244187.1 ABC transporter ATP-binding protein [Actinomyces sp.]MDO4244196.1 ABC transporter ATP-binding protein [Actinomyces sp.]
MNDLSASPPGSARTIPSVEATAASQSSQDAVAQPTTADPHEAIAVRGVSRFFGTHPAVQNLDLSVPAGTITGLVGPNGAGKTTLLLMLAALLAPDSGTIRVVGLDPVTQAPEVHRTVGWMPDAFGTWDSLTCTEILLTFAAAQGLPPADAAVRAPQTLATVHLEDMARAPARVLSRGQKQRLGLARALIHTPRVLLLDEPAAGMDPRSRADLRVLLRDLASAGTTILVSSHILGELEEMVDGVILMAHGRAVPTSQEHSTSSTSPAPLGPVPVRQTWSLRALDQAGLERWAREAGLTVTAREKDGLRILVPDDAEAARILRLAGEAGINVVSFAPVTGALEEIYLAMEAERR